MKLRDYQLQAIEGLRQKIRQGKRRLLLVSPTGSGKTVIASEMVRGAVSKGNTVLFLAHRRELILQAVSRLRDNGIDAGVIMAGIRPSSNRVQVASIHTLARRELPAARVIIVDEAHHATAEGYGKIIAKYPDATVLGLTATPFRLDGRGLGNLFEDTVKVATIKHLTDLGFLVPVRYWGWCNPDMSGVKKSKGDFDLSNFDVKLLGEPVNTYLSIGNGARAIAFCINIAHAKQLAEQFSDAGISAASIDANTDNAVRLQVLSDFNAGKIRVLTNCNILGEGYDCPAAEIVIMARPTASLGLYMQQIGRVLRPFAGKTEAKVFDHAGNVLRHGFIGEIEADLKKGVAKKKKSDAIALRTCPKCFAIMRSASLVCPSCGEMQKKEAKKVKYKTGTIVELNGVEHVKTQSGLLSAVGYLKELVETIKDKKYRRGWGFYRFKSRFKRNPTKSELKESDFYGSWYNAI